jgi:hypothetical protein
VLLTVNTAPGCQKAGSTGQGSSSSRSSAEVWLKAGSMPLVAKVADFGLALPLGPQDTHATMMARVRSNARGGGEAVGEEGVMGEGCSNACAGEGGVGGGGV